MAELAAAVLPPSAAPSIDEPAVVDGEAELASAAPSVAADDDIAVADAAPPPAQAPPEAAAEAQFDLPLPEGAAAAVDASSVDIHVEPGDTPSFVRRAEREARWRTPRARAALFSACSVAAVALAAQWVIAQRDLVAARSPLSKPLLVAACAALGCQVQPPRALEALRVESSGLARVDKSDLYRLSVALRNMRSHEVALPAFELALTDTQGQLIARRVLRAGELGARAGTLAAGADLTLQSTIQVGTGTVAGYTIELFYP